MVCLYFVKVKLEIPNTVKLGDNCLILLTGCGLVSFQMIWFIILIPNKMLMLLMLTEAPPEYGIQNLNTLTGPSA